ncbi:hypothetical protein HYALB_00005293 [Hymenoscyphus albidus]|uniref:DUF676 domain-containing protein n=1 Tax=Hymenoscyphus albidus TaxID=595503 RepID=A0A9N9PWV4_9HELO|nr:hypothetical protein HYALB_00005293 [Hymenoscyphus albidus]
MTGIKFYGSQVGGRGTTANTHTGSPVSLVRQDVQSALSYAAYVPFIFLPLLPQRSGWLGELTPTRGNSWSCFLHAILLILQVPFFLSVPFWLCFPGWAVLAGVIVFMGVNNGICYFLNGSRMEFISNEKYADATAHTSEQWVFLNGVAAGEHWLQTNIDRLALTFGRPVIGLHNKTNGILFDIIQCLIQRNFKYATNDIRTCYTKVKSILYTQHITKVVFVMHSQGAIEGVMILDWLLQEIPMDLLAKLEIYTFGNAANHFNNPHKHLLTQERALALQSRRKRPEHGKAIRHIEHYVHTYDFVAKWGILSFLNPSKASPEVPRFMGRAFLREGKGHLLTQHYLDSMFPLEPAPEHTEEGSDRGGIGGSGFLGADVIGNTFMEEDIDWVAKRSEARAGLRKPVRSKEDLSIIDRDLSEEDDEDEGDVGVYDESPMSTREGSFHGSFTNGAVKRQYKVKDISRLWQYRNGRSPQVDAVVASLERIDTV